MNNPNLRLGPDVAARLMILGYEHDVIAAGETFDMLATANGYIRLKPKQVVIDIDTIAKTVHALSKATRIIYMEWNSKFRPGTRMRQKLIDAVKAQGKYHRYMAVYRTIKEPRHD